MPKLLDRLRAKRAERKRSKAERLYQENRQGVPRRGSGAPRASSESGSMFKGGGSGGG